MVKLYLLFGSLTFNKRKQVKYRLLILLLILLSSIPALITALPPATTTITSLSPETSNNAAATNTTTADITIATAQSIYTSQSLTLPISVKSFVWYIIDEAHENAYTSSHKKVSDHSPDYLPTNVIIPQGVSLTFLDADAPWDTPHPHTINILNSSSRNVVYSTGKLVK